MKFYQISEILNNKKIRPSQISNNKKIYNYLYNDYTYRNNKKEKMRHDKLYHESELYPFSPLINKSGYITFSPNNIDNFTPYTSRYDFYRKNNPNQKYSTFTESYPVQRNILTENNLYDTNRYFNPNNIDDYRNLNNDYYNNGDIQNYFNKNLINNNKFKKGNKKGSLNRTGYGFYNPIYKPKNIYSNKDDEINSKISEYLNNFQNNSKRFNNLDSINNTNNDIYPKKRNKSNANISRGSKYNLLGEEQSQFNNNNEIPYNSNFKRINEINNNYNKINNNKYNSNKKKNNNQNKKNNKNNNNKNNKNNDKNNNNKEDDKNNKRIYNESNDYFYTFSKDNKIKNKNNNKDLSQKNSNKSLNPSSLGVDHMKTFYTNKQGNGVISNINTASERMLDTQYHFLNGLKMASGEVNEYFYDFNSNKKSNRDKNDDVQSLQSLSDSKMLELANMYLSDEENSVENYQMNNIIYNKKKRSNNKYI